jgi:hypothetical protein
MELLSDQQVDELVEKVELLTVDISRLNFTFDGLKEDADRLVEKQPYMVRQIQLNSRKMVKLAKILVTKNSMKSNLDAELGAYRIAKQEMVKDKKVKKDTNVNKKDKTTK